MHGGLARGSSMVDALHQLDLRLDLLAGEPAGEGQRRRQIDVDVVRVEEPFGGAARGGRIGIGTPRRSRTTAAPPSEEAESVARVLVVVTLFRPGTG